MSTMNVTNMVQITHAASSGSSLGKNHANKGAKKNDVINAIPTANAVSQAY